MMTRRIGKVLVACCGGVVLAGSVAALLGGGQVAELKDVGDFRWGSAAGEERAGFSGRPKLQVFANPDGADWSALKTCLGSADVQAALGVYTPILIDERDEAEAPVEARFREEGFQVVVRGLSGRVLGGLKRGFSCEELLGLLASSPQSPGFRVQRSPAYEQLLRSVKPLEELLEHDRTARAERLVGLLEEFEGPESDAVEAAKAALAQ